MSLNGAGLFLLSLIFLAIFYIVFNSDVFIASTLSGFPSLSTYSSDGHYKPTLTGELIILSLVILFYSVSYILLVNLD